VDAKGIEKPLTPTLMITYQAYSRCTITIEGRIKDCWFKNRSNLFFFLSF